MGKILDSAKKLEQQSKQKSEIISKIIQLDLIKQKKHFEKLLKENENTIENAIQDSHKRLKTQILKIKFSLLGVLVFGIIIGASLILVVLFLLIKYKIQL